MGAGNESIDNDSGIKHTETGKPLSAKLLVHVFFVFWGRREM